MKRNLVLNLIFISIFIIFFALSLTIDFFFFIPVVCFLPLSFRSIKQKNTKYENRTTGVSLVEDTDHSNIRYCPKCNGKITKSIAKFCYHCGEKLITE